MYRFIKDCCALVMLLGLSGCGDDSGSLACLWDSQLKQIEDGEVEKLNCVSAPLDDGSCRNERTTLARVPGDTKDYACVVEL